MQRFQSKFGKYGSWLHGGNRKYQHPSCLRGAYLAPTGDSSPDAVWGEHNVRPYFGTDHIGSRKRELCMRKFGQSTKRSAG